MPTPVLRFALLCLFCFGSAACGDDPAVERGHSQPGDACTSTAQCTVGLQCSANVCAQTDPYRITLTWEVDTDFDLHVRTPNGRELYFGLDNAEAWLGADDCGSEKCHEPDGTHYEHAYLRELASADVDAGSETDVIEYEYWVDNYGCVVAGDFILEVVSKDGTVEQMQSGTLPAACAESEHFIFSP